VKGKVALYPGTFDPVTNGHVDLVKRAATIFDAVIVAVAKAVHKNTFLTLDQRFALVKESLEGVAGIEVVTFDGLLVEEFRKR